MQFVYKPREFFAQKLDDLKRQVSTISKFIYATAKTLLALFQVYHSITKCKKRRTILEELILPAAIVERAAEKLKLVPISNNIVYRRIGNMAVDIDDQQIDQKKARICSAIR